MCLSSFSSRYVRFASTGVLNGFMIFFTATEALVNWSFAELTTQDDQQINIAVSMNAIH